MIPVRGWADFAGTLDWRAGEHVTLLGQTGAGKSWLASHLLGRRAYSVVIGTKPRDPSLKRFKREGWRRRMTWPPANADRRVLLWPRMREIGDVVEQRHVIGDALHDIYVQGAWAVYVDELPYVANTLGLASTLDMLWLQGRALGVSVVASAQRPVWIPMAGLSQASHLFLWRQTDDRDLKRLGEISGNHDRHEVAAVVKRLPPHAFLYLSTRGDACVSRAPGVA